MSTNIRGTEATAKDLIPGAFEPRPLKARQTGTMGGPAFGATGVPIGSSSMDAATINEHKREGGRLRKQRGGL